MGSSSCNNQRRRLGRPVACSGYFFANIFADSKKKHADITENWEGKHVSEEGGEKYHFFSGKLGSVQKVVGKRREEEEKEFDNQKFWEQEEKDGVFSPSPRQSVSPLTK